MKKDITITIKASIDPLFHIGIFLTKLGLKIIKNHNIKVKVIK